ncbi:hypothetical protein ISN44_As13g017470 [Arabidopsis suecica]|uniref:KIB1-4 beta-propeller domain-containing protein n=1 Tax=Arabidopsis suecica TaxID=45249 RepID=A0A8T1XYH1_ARASU|nr:hypothetical protein ISN44_As13g017470 [Arabidopsis suecica]
MWKLVSPIRSRVLGLGKHPFNSSADDKIAQALAEANDAANKKLREETQQRNEEANDAMEASRRKTKEEKRLENEKRKQALKDAKALKDLAYKTKMENKLKNTQPEKDPAEEEEKDPTEEKKKDPTEEEEKDPAEEKKKDPTEEEEKDPTEEKKKEPAEEKKKEEEKMNEELLNRLSRLRLGTVRSSPLILSNGFSTSLPQTPPCSIIYVADCGGGFGKLTILYAGQRCCTDLEKKVPLELMEEMGTIGASHGWVATLKDGVVCLQDDLNPFASDTNPKRIPLPALVTLPRCQTQIVTNLAMSSSSPEDEDCVVAVKFLGPQLSFCRPAQSNSEWINFRIENPCFYTSPVMFSKKDDMFRIPGSGGNLIGSWDPRTHKCKPKFQRLRFRNLPELTKTKRELLHSCCTSEHLVESRTTDETFLVKLYRKVTASGRVKMQTKDLMVFKLDEEGNAVYTKDIGDLSIFISKAEPFCVPASPFPGMGSNIVKILDLEESITFSLPYSYSSGGSRSKRGALYHIPPQNRV